MPSGFTCFPYDAVHLAAPKTVQRNFAFAVDGPCQLQGGCVTSPNYPKNYDDAKTCTITVATTGAVRTTAFNTEVDYDVLITPNGDIFSGDLSGKLPKFSVAKGDVFTWKADTSTSAPGWEMCLGTGLRRSTP